jgi:type IV secretory pathway VirB10-like protein
VHNINDLFTILALAIGCIITIFVGILEIFILIFIWEGTWNVHKRHHHKRRGINLEKLVSEGSGEASLARFQLLIFVFVIAMSLVLIITSGNPPSFPAHIPDQILGLLGISSTSYVLGKALQTQMNPQPPDPSIVSASPPPPPPDPSSAAPPSPPPPPDPSSAAPPSPPPESKSDDDHDSPQS